MHHPIATNIYKLRKQQGLSQGQVAKDLGISRPSYVNLEKGKKELTLSQLETLATLFKVSPQELQFGIAVSENEALTSKFKQLILNCIKFGGDKTDGKITKTKLAKLVYLAEFKWFYDNLKPLTGVAYKKLPQGPVADLYFRAVDELFSDGLLEIEQKGTAFMISLTESNVSDNLLKTEEMRVIKLVSKKWRNKNTEDIVNFTHQQLPWNICRRNEVIPIALITQEEPENVY